MSAGVIVIAEASPAGLTAASVRTISFARRLADATGEGLRVIIPGQRDTGGKLDNNDANIFALLEQTGGADMILISGESLAAYSAEAWKESLTPLCRELDPRFLCIPHTSRGWDYGPGLAILL